MIPIAILAGGLATRLGDVTKMIPKALLPIAGKPFIVHQLELLRAAGITEVVMCVAHLADQIEGAIGDGGDYGMHIQYSYDKSGEGPTRSTAEGGAKVDVQLLGTAGALRNALPLLGDEFLVMYGDSYLICDYAGIARAWQASGKLGLMTVFENHGQYDASNVEFREGRVLRYEKGVPGMTHIDWGLGAFRAAAFAGYPAGKLDLQRVYQDLLANAQLFGYEVTERFYEIGSHSGLEELRRILKDNP